MSGPWDDYKPQTQASSGPWDDYATIPKKASLPAGVPWKADDLATTPSSFLKDALPGPVMQSGDENSSIWQKIKDADKAAGAASQQFISGLVAPVNSLIEDFTGPNYLSRRIAQSQENDPNKTAQQAAYEQNINNVMNVMDPGQIGHGHFEEAPRALREEPIKPIPPKPTIPEGPWKDYTSQDELPFTNSVEDIAAQRNAVTNQGDLFNNNQGAAPLPYDPTARIPTEAQNELPLSNSVQDIANHVSNQLGQMDMFGGAENHVSKEPMSQIPEITPQVALRRALDAEDAGKAAEAAFWRERAMEMVREERAKQTANQQPIHVNEQGTAGDPRTMDALSRSTEGITYENVPPDGVIPRDANRLSNGEPMLRVPRGNDWIKDENGMPVRQGLPESTVAPDYINRYMRQDEPARNDLGNAIQEANGPKLGPDEHFGAGSLETSPRTYKNSQRGSIGGDVLNDAVQGIKKWFTGSPEHGRAKSYSLEEQAARKNAELQHAGPGQYITQDRDLAGVYGGPKGRAYEVHEPFSQPFDFNTTRDWGNGIKQSGDKVYKTLVEKLGSKAAANAYLKKSGFDAITFTSPRGEKIANIFNSRDLTDIGPAREPMKDFGELSLVPKDIGTISDKFNVELARAMRGKGSQGGVIDAHLADAAADLVRKAVHSFYELGAKPVRSIIGMLPEDHMARVSGEDMVYKPDPGQKFADKAVAEGQKNTSIWKSFQSGPLHTAEKPGVNSNALRGVGSWLQWADKRTHLDNHERINPIQGKVKKLSDAEQIELSKHMVNEQRTNMRQDVSHMSQKAQDAYKAMRDEFDRIYNQTVARAQSMGKEIPTREEAYHASIRQGDYHQSFFTKSGQLIGHVASESKLHALKAEAYFRKLRDDIDWTKSQISYAPDFKGVNVPRDILGAYQNMLKFFDDKDPTIALIQDSISKYQEEKGFSSRGFDQRLIDKMNVPGFEGDKPWLSDKENARAFFNSQLKYMRDANHWNNFQEALHQIEPIMKNEDLVKHQPDIMEYAKAVVQRELGISSNVLDRLEREWARNWPKVGIVDGKVKVAQGISRGNLYKGVSDLKTGTYLTMLGVNIPYIITTPIQAALSIPRHMMLTEQGINHNPLNTIIKSMGDIGAGLARHMASSLTGKNIDIPISDIGKRMLQYAEQNGILDKTVLDETGDIHGHAVAQALKKTVGATITAPEKLTRYSTFVSFAHHIMDSGKFTEAEAFQMAERMTNDSLTSMRRLDKPLIVDKFGATGQLGYVFKSYLFNYYNQMAEYAGHAKRGNAAPLAAFVGLSFLMGGALSLPGVNEMDGFYNIFKNIMASKFPQYYHDDLGVKGTLLRDLPTVASMGALSDLTGTNIGSRFNTQITNPENPLGDIAVPIQELKEASTALDWVADPTERHALQAVHANMGSTLKGQMETKLDSFKNKNPNTPDGRDLNGRMAYRKASNINDISTDYKRTSDEEAKRSLGFYSQDEYKTKQLRYINNTEQARTVEAFTNLMNKALTKGVDGNAEAAGKLATAALRLVPDTDRFTKMVDEAALAHGATPEERMAIRAQTINNLEKLRRLQSATH